MLTREKALAFEDITVKEITIPVSIPVWGGETLFIKQLTRGQQDAYNLRRMGGMRMKQDPKAKQQDISGVSLFGHDAWLVVNGAVDEQGKQIFKSADIDKLNEKSGEAIGWIAQQIIIFSGMADDLPIEDEVKN